MSSTADSGRGQAQFVGATTGRVQVGRYIVDPGNPAGTLLYPAPRKARSAPPPELVQGIADEGPGEPEPNKEDLIDKADRLVDKASDVTDKVENVVELTRAIVEGRALEANTVTKEIAALLALVERLDRNGHFKDAIRLARPLCRLCALTLRWAALIESLRLVFHAATALADSRTIAWSQHELGTLHQVAGDVPGARQLLDQARRTRQEIGDEEGLAATTHNLELLGKRALPMPSTPAFVAAGAIVLVVAVLALASGTGSDHGTPSNAGSTNAAAARSSGQTSAVNSSGPSSGQTSAVKNAGLSSSTTATQPNSTATSSSGTQSSSGPGQGAAVALVSPTLLRFGDQAVHDPTTAQPLTVTNHGTAALDIKATPGGSDPGDFSVANSCRPVAPGRSCTVEVTFDPHALGSRSATVTFVGSAQQIQLTGTGTGVPTATVVPSSIDFGAVEKGVQSVKLTNSGDGSLIVQPAGISGDPEFTVSHDTCSQQPIAPQGSCTMTVAYSSQDGNAHSARLQLTDNAPNDMPTVDLTAQAAQAAPNQTGDNTGTGTAG
ncbi:MAG TPA: choice-of-anchor D domain-containing protein [Solirubrobacteraceae bacterium]